MCKDTFINFFFLIYFKKIMVGLIRTRFIKIWTVFTGSTSYMQFLANYSFKLLELFRVLVQVNQGQTAQSNPVFKTIS